MDKKRYIATGMDHQIIDSVSVALKGEIGNDDDTQRLIASLVPTDPKLRENALAEIAVAFIRWAQDLKRDRNTT